CATRDSVAERQGNGRSSAPRERGAGAPRRGRSWASRRRRWWPLVIAADSQHEEDPATRKCRGVFLCAPSMGAILEVQVLCVSDHRDRSEAQLREGDRAWEGSVKRSDGPTNRNRIEGDAERGERAKKRKSR